MFRQRWKLIKDASLLGQTGAGKSHASPHLLHFQCTLTVLQFINVAAGAALAPTNDNTLSRDLTIRSFKLKNPQSNRNVVFVDTPGFDHFDASDEEILGIINDWIRTSSASSTHFSSNVLIHLLIRRCPANALFGGIIYLHDITIQKPIFGPTWPLGYLASPEPVGHLLLTTVNWDRMTEEHERAAIAREDELKTQAWKPVLKGGAQIRRFLNTYDSAWMAVNTLLELNPLELHVLQRELERICVASKRIRKPPLPRKGFFSSLFGFFGRSQVCVYNLVSRKYNLHLS